jgi:hypothetical protein
MSMPYSTAGATLRRANIAAGLPYATTSPRATNKSSAIVCLFYAGVESGDLGAKRGDDFGRRGFKPDVRIRVFCASALPVVVTLASPTTNKIINNRMGDSLFDCWLSASGGIGQPSLPGLGHESVVQSRPGANLLFGLPLFHVGSSLTQALTTLSGGGCLVVLSPAGWRNPASIKNIWSLVERFKSEALTSVPTVLAALAIPLGNADISSLRYAQSNHGIR